MRISRRNLGAICSTILVVVMGVVVFPSPAGAVRRNVQGLQFGQPVDVTTCQPNSNVALMLNDQPLLDRTSWVRIDFRAAGTESWPTCDLAGAYHDILATLSTRASWIEVIGLASNEFVWGRDNTIDPQEFADAAIRVACDSDHYGAVDVWEIWNEPTLAATRLEPDTFAQLIGLSSRTIRTTCGKVVISGGINPEGVDVEDPRAYLSEVNAAFVEHEYGNYESLVRAVNGIGLHPYVLPMDELDAGHQRMADFIWALKQDYRDEPLYVTEFGWRIGEVEEPAQCDNLVHAFNYLEGQVEAAVWFTLRDFGIADKRYGLYDDSTVARPAYRGYLFDECDGPTDGAYDPATDSLRWTDLGPTATYEVALARAGESTYTILKTVGDKQVPLPTFNPVVPNGTYTWKVTRILNGKRYPSKKWAFTYVARPPAPASIAATVLGPNSVKLTWPEVVGETRYEVTNNVTIRQSAANVPTLTWDGIPGGTYMCFRARAVNDGGPSAWTAWACVTTTGVLTAPTGQTAVATSPTTVKVSWTDNSTNETGFEITDNLTTRTVGPNINTMVWDTLPPGTHKCFRIRAANAAGFSLFTPWACVDTPSLPAAPSAQTAVATGPTTIKVSWNDNSNNETGFEVFSNGATRSFPASTQTMVWDSLPPATLVCFQIRAVNTWGVSAWTPSACATTGAVAPNAPTGTTAVATNGNTIKVGWVDNSNNETSFEVFGNGVLRGFGPNTTAIDWSGVPFGGTVCFQVRAVNAAGASALSTMACATTPAPPFAPSGQTAVGTSTTTIKVGWVDNSNNESYFEITNGATSVTVGANLTSFVWGGLPPAKSACFAIRAVNNIGASAYTPYVCASTLTPPPPAAPSNVFAAQTGSTTVKVTWVDNSNNETGFQIIDASSTYTVGPNTTVFVRNGRPPVPQICFQVRAFNDYGYSAWSAKVCAKTV